MKPELFEKVAEVFLAARSVTPEEREILLLERCGQCDELRREVQRLLAADQRCGDGLDDDQMQAGLDLEAVRGLFTEGGSASTEAWEREEILPAAVGRYRIIRKIGEGGMGLVCEAEQDNPRRLVAIKILRAGLGSAGVIRRFSHEVQILARLHHPGIARIYEAGTIETTSGAQPYFAMELITGKPLLTHATWLTVVDRLGLFLLICEAVEYAHTKGVIHRDLKPANILVDEHGQPRILDFGVAHVTESDMQVTTMRTDPGQLVGTLPYMSPEQVSGDTAEVDTRSDVYALGVVLFQMLSGMLPLNTRSMSIADAARIIRDQEPTRLGSVDSSFRGDLETIVSRALEKKASRRYQSAAALATDLRHHLNHEPIDARPTTRLYQVTKFARRHPELVAGFAAAVVAIALGLAGTSWGLFRARQQRDAARSQTLIAAAREAAAERSATRAGRLASAMRVIVEAANPRGGAAATDGTIELLTDAARKAGVMLADEPEAELDIRLVLGKTFRDMGARDGAIYNYERADALAVSVYGGEHPNRLEAAEGLVTALCETVTGGTSDDATLKRARALAERTYEVALRVLGSLNPTTVSLLNSSAYLAVYAGVTPEGTQLHRELIAVLRQLQPEQRPCSLSFALARFAVCLGNLHDESGARAAADEAMAIFRGGAEPNDLDTVTRQMGLHDFLLECERLDDAIELLNLGATRAQERLGASHMTTLSARSGLGALLSRKGDSRSALEIRRDVMQGEWPLYHRWEPGKVIDLGQLATLLAMEQRLGEAQSALSEGMEILLHTTDSQAGALMRGLWCQSALFCGLRTLAPWVSESLRLESRFVFDAQLNQVPSTALNASTIRWDRFSFRFARHGSPEAPWQSGDLEQIMTHPDLDPGLYRFEWSVPDGEVTRSVQDWSLCTRWRIQKFGSRFYKLTDENEWAARIELGPDETVDAGTITALGWCGRGFGPMFQDYTFGLVAETEIDLPPGVYEFGLTADDGGRVILDGKTILDMWPDRRRSDAWERVVRLESGAHSLRVEYVQAGGMSRLRLRVAPLDPVLPG